MTKRTKKKPKVKNSPQLSKHPKVQFQLGLPNFPLAWRFSDCDRGGNWAWTNLQEPIQYKKVVERLQEFESKNWNEIERSGSHPIPIQDIVISAKNRLRELKMDDIDELMSFRLTGKQRVWCIKQSNVMKVLWWDPSHEICPAPKRHT